MKARLKQWGLLVAAAGLLYFILSNHIIFDVKDIKDWNFYLLKKSNLDLHYTFYSISQKRAEDIIRVNVLREDGVGDLLVEIGMITEEKKNNLESKYSYDDE